MVDVVVVLPLLFAGADDLGPAVQDAVDGVALRKLDIRRPDLLGPPPSVLEGVRDAEARGVAGFREPEGFSAHRLAS